MKLEQIVHRMATDEGFASAVRKDLEGTLAREGIHLRPEEILALKSTLSGADEARDLISGLLDPVIWHSPQFDPRTS